MSTSTSAQVESLRAQTLELEAAGCERVFTDIASGARSDQPGLAAAVAYLRVGDTTSRSHSSARASMKNSRGTCAGTGGKPWPPNQRRPSAVTPRAVSMSTLAVSMRAARTSQHKHSGSVPTARPWAVGVGSKR